MYSFRAAQKTVAVSVALLSLTACSGTMTRLAEIGREPPLTTVQNPTKAPHYRPVSMPMPDPRRDHHQPSSLWRTGARAFFKDQRAGQIGDIVTVVIAIEDSAEISNSSTRSRSDTDDVDFNNLLGLEGRLGKVLPDPVSPDSLVDLQSSSNNTGSGTINRDEEITLTVAAVVSQVLPNGNLVILGRQETRVNFEVRELQVAGVVRPEDITANNTVSFDKIAEARLSYGGRGHITDAQQPRYGRQVFDILFPF